MNFLWRQFPIFYTLPFVAATLAIEPVAEAGNIARWVVVGIGSLLAGLLIFEGKTTRSEELTMADVPILLFLGFFVASAYWSINPTYTLERAASVLLLYLTAFWTLRVWARHFSEDLLVEKVLWTLAACLAVNLALGLVFDRAGLATARFQGVFTNPNNIADMTALCAPLAFGRLVVRKRLRDWAVLAVVGASMIACGNRTALLATLTAGALMISFGVIRKRRIALLISGVMVVFLAALSQTSYFKENILRANTIENMSNRTRFWDLAREQYIPQRPKLGHGFGTDALINEYYDNDLTDLHLRGYGVMSSYYGLAVQVGIPATVVFFGLLWGVAGLGLIRFPLEWRVVVYGATVVAGLIVGITESVIYSAGNCFAFLFWMVMMLLLRKMQANKLAIAASQAKARAERRRRRREQPNQAMPPPAKHNANSPLHGQP